MRILYGKPVSGYFWVIRMRILYGNPYPDPFSDAPLDGLMKKIYRDVTELLKSNGSNSSKFKFPPLTYSHRPLSSPLSLPLPLSLDSLLPLLYSSISLSLLLSISLALVSWVLNANPPWKVLYSFLD